MAEVRKYASFISERTGGLEAEEKPRLGLLGFKTWGERARSGGSQTSQGPPTRVWGITPLCHQGCQSGGGFQRALTPWQEHRRLTYAHTRSQSNPSGNLTRHHGAVGGRELACLKNPREATIARVGDGEMREPFDEPQQIHCRGW